MDIDLKAKLIEYLKTVESTVSDAGEFVKAELPMVVSEYVSWCLVSGSIGCVLCTIGAVLGAVFSFKAWGWITERENDGLEPLIILPICICAGCFAGSIQNGLLVTKAYVAPRIVVGRLQEQSYRKLETLGYATHDLLLAKRDNAKGESTFRPAYMRTPTGKAVAANSKVAWQGNS